MPEDGGPAGLRSPAAAAPTLKQEKIDDRRGDQSDPEEAPAGERRGGPSGRARAPQADRQSDRRVVELAPKGKGAPGTPAKDRGAAKEPREPFVRRHPFAILIALLVFIAMAAAGYVYWDHAQRFESTDDAFIASRQFPIAPKVSGFIAAVPVTDNQHVGANDVIARIDDRDFRVALEQAMAQVGVAQGNVQNLDAQITVQQAQVNASQSQVQQTQAALVFAQQQAAAYQELARRGSGTVQNAQQFASQLHQQEAALGTAEATLASAQRQLQSLDAQRKSAQANLDLAKAQQDQAQLNLSYTTVTAGQAGHVANLSAAVGAFVQAGTALTMFVPDEIWVTANFKETQLDAMRPGNPVTLEIDAYPGRVIRGHVASVQRGSGTAFSLLPAQNATGNFVKIVQRVPVKLILDNPPTDVALGPGMSAVPTVRVDPTPSLYERLRRWLWPSAQEPALPPTAE